MFRLAVLPGTVMAEKAAAAGLEYSREAPYEVTATPAFSREDLAAAEKLSAAADIFYNRGRAVPWFLLALYPLKIKPSAFLWEFAGYMETKNISPPTSSSPDLPAIQKHQLAFLEKKYRDKNKLRQFAEVRRVITATFVK
jgi:hypothetical protein